MRQQVAAFDAIALPQSPPAPPRAAARIDQRAAARCGRPVVLHRLRRREHHAVRDAAGARRDHAVHRARAAARRPRHDRAVVGGSSWTGELPQDREALLERVRAAAGRAPHGERARPDLGPRGDGDHARTDPQAQAQVARRYFENDIIPGGRGPWRSALRRELDVSSGHSRSSRRRRARPTPRRARMQAVARGARADLGGAGRRRAAARRCSSSPKASSRTRPSRTSARSCRPRGTRTWRCTSSMSEAGGCPAGRVWRAGAPKPPGGRGPGCDDVTGARIARCGRNTGDCQRHRRQHDPGRTSLAV